MKVLITVSEGNAEEVEVPDDTVERVRELAQRLGISNNDAFLIVLRRGAQEFGVEMEPTS